MAKLVVLKLTGNLESGFQIAIEMGEDGQQPKLKMDSALPANPELAEQSHQHWNNTYRHLGHSSRIKRPEVIYGGHLNPQIQACQESAKQLEQHLNEWLSSASFQNVREEWRDFVRKHEDVRVLVQTKDPSVEKLPWHSWNLLKCDYEKAEIALAYSQYKGREPSLPNPKEKVRVLAIFGSSEGIDLNTDRQLLEDLGDRAELEIFVEPDRQEINDRLWEKSWDIIFFAGHSETQGNEGSIYLNSKDRLTLTELWYGLRKAVENGLQLAIFNSCDGLGLARSLDDILIPQTIVMRERVPDLVAQDFLRYFLQAFANGQSLYLSVREARERLQGLEDKYPCATWLPVIYQNPAEIPLLWDEYLGRSGSAPEPVKLSPPPSPPHRKIPVVAAIALLFGLGAIAYPTAIATGTQLNRWGVANIREKRYDRARFYLELALRLGAHKPRVLNNLGYLYERMGELDLARENFRQAKLLGDPFGCNNEAFIHLIQGQSQQADELLRSCVGQMQSINSEFGEYIVRKNLGWALLMKPGDSKPGDYFEAEQHLNAAIELRPKNGTANCVLAQVFEAQNRTSEALEQWKFCWDYAPSDRAPESDWKNQAQQRLESDRRSK
jgi:tetratricopeptide (TPR) repeat protein